MARVTVEDCLEQEPNRFNLTLLAAKRARQLEGGKDPLIENTAHHKDTVLALLEIANGLVDEEMMEQSTAAPDNEAAIAEGLARMESIEEVPSAVHSTTTVDVNPVAEVTSAESTEPAAEPAPAEQPAESAEQVKPEKPAAEEAAE